MEAVAGIIAFACSPAPPHSPPLAREWAPARRARASEGPRVGRPSAGPNSWRRRLRGAAHAAQDFFQADVVEYGSRYSRPDRFPRLKQVDRGRRSVDVRDWVRRLVSAAEERGFRELSVPGCEQVLSGPEWAARARELRLLTQQGRLEEALARAEGWDLAGTPEVASAEASEAGAGVLDHGAVMLAAVDAGDVALAFEYAALLPPRVDWYSLLIAAFAIRADGGAATLARDTALRRGIALDALTLLLGIAAAARAGDRAAYDSSFAAAVSRGYCTLSLSDPFWPVLTQL